MGVDHVLRAVDEQVLRSRGSAGVALNAVHSGGLTVEGASAALKVLNEQYERDLNALVERVRQEIVAPACRRLKMRFSSGMGTYDFKKVEHAGNFTAPTYSSREDVYDKPPVGYRALSSAAKEELGAILDLLHEEDATGKFELGQYMGDAP
jgi:hypothetical protein